MNNDQQQDETLSQMVADAYGKLAGDAVAGSKPAVEAVAQAYAGVPSSGALQRFDQLQAARGNTTDAYAAIQPRGLISFFNPTSAPCRGMNSAMQPSALPIGQFALLQNVRIDDGSIRARPGTTNRSPSGLPGGTGSSRGVWSGTMNGTTYVVGAWFDGSKVGLYSSTDGSTFTTATSGSGAFGDTRMTDTSAPVMFQVATNKADGKDYLVVQNGKDNPRVYSPTSLYSEHVWQIQSFNAPLWAQSTYVSGYMGSYGGVGGGNLLVQASTNVSITATGGNFTVAQAGLDNSCQRITFPTTIPAYTVGSGAATDYLVIDLKTSYTLLGSVSQQLVFAADQADSMLWQYLRLEISPDNSTWTTVSDPTSSVYYAPLQVAWSSAQFPASPSYLSGGLNGEELVAFPISQLSNPPLMRYMRLSWVGPASSQIVGSSVTLDVHGVFFAGNEIAFGSSFAVSMVGGNGTMETPGAVYAGVAPLTLNWIYFGQGAGQVFLPYSAGLYYYHLVPVQTPALSDVEKGCDTAFVYQGDLTGSGNVDYFYRGSLAVAEYSGGSWVYTSTSTSTPPTDSPSFDDGQYPNYESVVDVSRYVPDSYTVAMPVGTAMAYADGRLFVGGQGFYYVSEYDQAFRFRPTLEFLNGQPVARSATYVTLPGQTVQAFATPSGAALASSTVFFWTQTKTYATSGFDGFSLSRPNCLAEVGCSAPQSVTQYKDVIYFLDDNLQLRRFGYGHAFYYGYSNANDYDLMPTISRRVVDDRTTTIPVSRLPWVSGAASFDRFYLAYTPAGGSVNAKILVFEEALKGFVEDTFATGAESVHYADLSGGRTLLLAGHDGPVYTHEDLTSSVPQAIEITTPEIHNEMWKSRFYGRVGLVADVQSGQSATVTRTVKPGAVSNAGTLDLATNAAGQVWRWDSYPTSTQPGESGVSCQVDLQMTMVPGSRIYSLIVETAADREAADQM